MHRREGKLIVSATDLVGFLACGHLTRLERAAAAGLVDKPKRDDDPVVDLLRWRGGKHEERYIEILRENGRVITDLSANKGLPYVEQAAATEQLMRDGADIIYQGTVFDGRWLGYPDFLLRVDGASALGEWQYEVADTKLAHSAKASALIQICSYVEHVARIQGRQPEKVYVVTGGAEATPHEFRTAEMMAYFRHAKSHFEEALDDAVAGSPTYPIDRATSYPDPVEHCAVCKWFYEFCRQQWRDDDALPLVAGISRKQREVLQANEVITMTALSGLPTPMELKGMKPKQAESMIRMREQARLQVESLRAEKILYELLPPGVDGAGVAATDRGLSALPEPSEFDLFFDIEGDPFAFWEGLEYLFGVWDGAAYRSFWALDRDQEKQAFQDVMDLFHARWKEHPEMHVYHYGAYEPSRLKHLAGRHATREEQLDELLRGRVFVDLLRVVRQGVRVGVESYSIKRLEPLYGYTREIELRDANSSIVEFEKILEMRDPGDELKELILGYNADDCRSTHHLRDWLEQRRLEYAQRHGVELPRPPEGVLEPGTEDLREHIRRVQELMQRLTVSIVNDPGAQSEAEKATWMVAHLLDWHRREEKSTWWRYYDLLTKTDDELFEESEPIGHLELLERFEPGGRSRSYVYRYRFPPQEHKIDLGYVDDPQIEGKKKTSGEVVAIDDDAGTIDIRRAKTWTGPHPSSIIQVKSVDPRAQREALLRFGNWVAANGIDSQSTEWRAARDLLLRMRPRLAGGSGGELARPGEPGSDAARRLATELDGTTLAIQGPPGSGKTFTGARMIVDLIRAGRAEGRPRVVGITSNSHKVIANLVEAVIEAAGAERLRIIQKGKEDEAYMHPAVRRVEDNSDVDEALAEEAVDLIAGTPWLWAREEMTGRVDTLFVDEAGQVSLANVIAVSGAARNVVLLGDPQQLDQPVQGVHPPGAGVSALGHLLAGLGTVPPDRGLFLEQTYRMHPRITRYTSDLFYDGKLESVSGLERQEVLEGPWAGSGLQWVPVPHTENTNESRPEADAVVGIVRDLIGSEWRNHKGEVAAIGQSDVLVVSPFNAHRILIEKLLNDAGFAGVEVGTVDKFQGQQAAVSIYTMATSRPEDAPRGMGFLYSLNRLNVATSRARALAIVVASPLLLRVVPQTPDQLRMANGLCAFVDAATGARLRQPVLQPA